VALRLRRSAGRTQDALLHAALRPPESPPDHPRRRARRATVRGLTSPRASC